MFCEEQIKIFLIETLKNGFSFKSKQLNYMKKLFDLINQIDSSKRKTNNNTLRFYTNFS